MSEKVLATGGFGLVGSQTVRRLVADGHLVVATDLGTRDQSKAARSLPTGAEAHWADLTDPGEVDRLVADTSPTVIIHADPWGAIRAKLGEPRPDTRERRPMKSVPLARTLLAPDLQPASRSNGCAVDGNSTTGAN